MAKIDTAALALARKPVARASFNAALSGSHEIATVKAAMNGLRYSTAKGSAYAIQYAAIKTDIVAGRIASYFASRGDNRESDALIAYGYTVRDSQAHGSKAKDGKRVRTEEEQAAFKSADVLAGRIMKDAGIKSPKPGAKRNGATSGKSKATTAKQPVVRLPRKPQELPKAANINDALAFFDNARGMLMAYVNKNAKLASGDQSWNKLRAAAEDFAKAVRAAAPKAD